MEKTKKENQEHAAVLSCYGDFARNCGMCVAKRDEFILLTTEAKWYRNDHMTGKGVPELEAAASSGDEFLIDYVRVYDIVEAK